MRAARRKAPAASFGGPAGAVAGSYPTSSCTLALSRSAASTPRSPRRLSRSMSSSRGIAMTISSPANSVARVDRHAPCMRASRITEFGSAPAARPPDARRTRRSRSSSRGTSARSARLSIARWPATVRSKRASPTSERPRPSSERNAPQGTGARASPAARRTAARDRFAASSTAPAAAPPR